MKSQIIPEFIYLLDRTGRAECDKWSIIKRCLISLNSEYFFKNVISS